jgi:type IX secretion system PorP/SprF family membrane protein
MKKIILIVFILLNLSVYSQQDALFSQYMFNNMIINPAYTENKDILDITLVHRNQWVGFDNSPMTSTISIQTPLKNNNNVFIGGYIYNDKLGPCNITGIMFNYNYKVRIYNGKLSFGIQAGVIQNFIDLNSIDMKDPNDKVILDIYNTNILTPDFNFGIYYQHKKWFLGISSKHLFEDLYLPKNNYYSTYEPLTRHLYIYNGYLFNINKIDIKPSVLIRYTKNAPISIDLNTNFYLNNKFMLGLSYRTNINSIVLLCEIELNKKLKIGYSYDMSINKLSLYNLGSHEIMLNWSFDIYNRYNKSLRYY